MLPIPGTFGIMDEWGQVYVPVGNVGTIIQFVSEVKDYEYVEVEVQGLASQVSMMTAWKTMLSCDAGAITGKSRQLCIYSSKDRITSSTLFRIPGEFTIKRITAFYATSVNSVFRKVRNAALCDITPMSGFVDDGEKFVKTVTPGVNSYVIPVVNVKNAVPIDPVVGERTASILVKVSPAKVNFATAYAGAQVFHWIDSVSGFTYWCYSYTEFEFLPHRTT